MAITGDLSQVDLPLGGARACARGRDPESTDGGRGNSSPSRRPTWSAIRWSPGSLRRLQRVPRIGSTRKVEYSGRIAYVRLTDVGAPGPLASMVRPSGNAAALKPAIHIISRSTTTAGRRSPAPRRSSGGRTGGAQAPGRRPARRRAQPGAGLEQPRPRPQPGLAQDRQADQRARLPGRGRGRGRRCRRAAAPARRRHSWPTRRSPPRRPPRASRWPRMSATWSFTACCICSASITRPTPRRPTWKRSRPRSWPGSACPIPIRADKMRGSPEMSDGSGSRPGLNAPPAPAQPQGHEVEIDSRTDSERGHGLLDRLKGAVPSAQRRLGARDHRGADRESRTSPRRRSTPNERMLLKNILQMRDNTVHDVHGAAPRMSSRSRSTPRSRISSS